MTWLFQHRIPYYTNTAEDAIVNTFHLDWPGVGSPGASDYLAAATRIRALYNGIFTSATLAAWAPWVNLAAATMKVYDLNDPMPRVPVYQDTLTPGGVQATSSTTPPEVALCISYQADPLSGVPQARRRGRIYIGGLGPCITAGTSSAFPLPTSTILTSASNAASTLVTALGSVSWAWMVYSRTLNSAALVTNGWVDNAFDTQRRRGQKASARTLWT